MSDNTNTTFWMHYLKKSESGAPTTVFAPVGATVAAILEDSDFGDLSGQTLLVNGQSVEGDYVPPSGSTIVVAAKKYSSGR